MGDDPPGPGGGSSGSFGDLHVAALAALVTYSSEAAWSAAVGSFVTESFNNSGLQPTTGVVTSAGQIDGNKWHDRVTLSGGESTTFRYLLGSMHGDVTTPVV